MNWFLNSLLFPGILGFVVAFLAITSGAFKEGGGLVLAFLVVVAVIVAAIAGVFSSLLPAAVAFWTARIALFCLVFAVSTWLLDR